METAEEIADLNKSIQRLAELDREFRVFGSETHKYEFGPVLTEEQLSSFESAHGITLPADYRCFLATVGNGGAGPNYGMKPLGTFGRDLSKPFPFTEATEGLPDELLDEYGDRDYYPGILEFSHHGCAIYSYLVVNGPTYGKIWDGREDFFPTNLSFSKWYRRWVERAIRSLENETLVTQLRLGMTKDEVINSVGGDWKARKALGRPISYFEASEIPVQLELDENDIVVKIKPWMFI